MPKVHFLNEVVTIDDVPKGSTIYEVAQKAGVQLFKGFFQSYHCAGKGRCMGAGCRVWVTELEQNAVPKKKRKWWLPYGRKLLGTQRMACEAPIQGDCEVRTQPGTLEVDRDTTWEPDPRHFKWQDRLVVEKKKKKKPAPKPTPAAKPKPATEAAEAPKPEAAAEAPKPEPTPPAAAEAPTPEPTPPAAAEAPTPEPPPADPIPAAGEAAGKPPRERTPRDTDAGWDD